MSWYAIVSDVSRDEAVDLLRKNFMDTNNPAHTAEEIKQFEGVVRNIEPRLAALKFKPDSDELVSISVSGPNFGLPETFNVSIGKDTQVVDPNSGAVKKAAKAEASKPEVK